MGWPSASVKGTQAPSLQVVVLRRRTISSTCCATASLR